MAVVGLEQTFYSTREDGGSVEVCVVVYIPGIDCPIKFPFTVLLSTRDFSAGICTSIKNHLKGDIGMANYEKQVEQEAAYPIPISLYNCYRTMRHEKRYQEYIDSYASLLLPHCPVTVVQRYRDWVCSLLFHLFFIICHPYIPLHLEEMIFYTCCTHF